jgi:hypothetical protein
MIKYYCIIKNNSLLVVSEHYYELYRNELVAIAVGTIEEIRCFLDDLGIMLNDKDIQ